MGLVRVLSAFLFNLCYFPLLTFSDLEELLPDCYTVLLISKKSPECYSATRKVLPLAGGNRECAVIAHYNPKGFPCVRGSPLTPLRMMGLPRFLIIHTQYMAQTSIHIEPCNIGSSERHNLRSKELDYIRPELSHLNESWTKQEITPCLENIKTRYKETTGQNMQKKATPIREGVVVIEPGTSMQQLKNFAEKLHERWGIKTIQIHTHKDEGYTPEDKPGEWKPNLHAHMIFDWTDDTGKSLKLKKQDLAEMQTMLAECLNMERGVSSDRKHLNSIQYKAMKEAERVIVLEKQVEQARKLTAHLPVLKQDYREALEQYDTARNNLDQAAQRLQELKDDIRNTELKKTATKAGKAVLGAIERTFSSKKMESMENEIKSLKTANKSIRQQTDMQLNTAKENMTRFVEQKDSEIRELKDELKEVQRYFPTMESAGRNIKQLRKLGVADMLIQRLLLGQELTYSGGLYDTEHRHTHQVENISIRIAPSTKGGMFVWLNDKNVTEFFRELWLLLQQALGLNRGQNQERDRGRGFRM